MLGDDLESLCGRVDTVHWSWTAPASNFLKYEIETMKGTESVHVCTRNPIMFQLQFVIMVT